MPRRMKQWTPNLCFWLDTFLPWQPNTQHLLCRKPNCNYLTIAALIPQHLLLLGIQRELLSWHLFYFLNISLSYVIHTNISMITQSALFSLPWWMLLFLLCCSANHLTKHRLILLTYDNLGVQSWRQCFLCQSSLFICRQSKDNWHPPVAPQPCPCVQQGTRQHSVHL